MANNTPQAPAPNLADILRNLAALAPQNQNREQGRSTTPEGLPLCDPALYPNPAQNAGQYGTQTQPQQPWQPPSQNHTPWQPLPQQQTWQPPQQTMNQQSYQQISNFTAPHQPHQRHQQQSHHPSHAPAHQQLNQMARKHQPMPDPQQVQMQQMSDPHHLQRMKEKEAQRRGGLDPATIIDWPTGLRCVMKTVAMNEKVISEIKKLIQVQNSHETQWFTGRKALIMASQDRAVARRNNAKKAASILSSLGPAAYDPASSNPDALPTPEQEAEALKTELEVYDAKVYRAQFQMVREMTEKLRALGVPFFGTKSGLVVLKSRPSSKESTPVDGGNNKENAAIERKRKDMGLEDEKKRAREQGKIIETELVELQRKMLGILQDLCEEK